MMRASDRLELLDIIGRDLQRRYTFAELDLFLKTMRIKGLEPSARNDSKWAYAKERLVSVANSDLARLANELEIPVVDLPKGIDEDDFAGARFDGSTLPLELPDVWQGRTQQFRLFISHLSANKQRAHRLKEELAHYGVIAFVAHDDIEPTRRWADEIVKALNAMDAFVAVLTDGFKHSPWCNQEIGFAVKSGVKMISFKMGEEDPPGFLAAEQALPWRKGALAGDVAQEIVRILWRDARTQKRFDNSYYLYASGNSDQASKTIAALRERF